MSLFPSLYKRVVVTKLFLLLFCFLLVTRDIQAQEEVIDTVVAADEYNDDYTEPPAEEKSGYFLHRWMEGYGMDSLLLRQLPDSVIQALKKDKDFWYADSVFKNQQRQGTMYAPQQNDSGRNRRIEYRRESDDKEKTGNPFLQTLLWIVIIGGFVAFLIIFLSNSNVSLFRKKDRRIDDDSAVEETEDIFAINYQKEIDKAAAAGNYRVAIRLMFLRTLKNMAERNIIRYQPDRTNLDYLMQLSSTTYYNDFFRITRHYEYSWYGHFEVNQESYQLIKKEFENFDPLVKS